MINKEQDYWTKRYHDNETGWDIGYASTPIKDYVDQMTNTSLKILVPGAGNGFEAEYLWKMGYKNVHILDVSEVPLTQFKKRNPDFPETQMHHLNFFDHFNSYDLIIEQTFFCSMLPTDENRKAYAKHMANLLEAKGKLVGVWFDIPLVENSNKRPFGGDKELYLNYLSPYFNTITFDRCYNSIAPRQGNELFGIFQKNNP